MADYWNHNTAYHPWLTAIAASPRKRARRRLRRRSAARASGAAGTDGHRHRARPGRGTPSALLNRSGELAVGFGANNTVADWMWSGLCLPAVRVASQLHGETRDIGVVTAEPRESLRGIRHIADEVIPGASIRRALYYRYLLRWRRP